MSEGKQVLLIEDEPNIVEAVRFILSKDGWIVHTHSDGATAMTAVERRRPRVIVLDAMLPNRSGFEILRDLRDREDTRDIPVLMLTARGQAKDRERAQEAGVSAYMTKPFSNAEMLKAVNDLVGVGRVDSHGA